MDFEAVLATLFAEAAADREAWARDGWARVAAALASTAPAFIAWAREHRRWSFIVAEAANDVCAKPPELAAWILHAAVDELLDEA